MYIDFLNINKINHQRIKFFILDRFEKKSNELNEMFKCIRNISGEKLINY